MTNKNELETLVARIRRVWGNESVEVGSGTEWLYRVTPPNGGKRVQLHGSPSDRNWKVVVMRQLDNAGFSDAEQAYLKKQEDLKSQKIAADRLANEQRTQVLTRQAEMLQRAAGTLTAQSADLGWVFGKHEFPETRRLIVDPELARKILEERNNRNRRLVPTRVERWRKVMRNGEWAYTHQGIAFDVTGNLQDGQHRLAACVAENFPLDINVTVGMPEDNFTKVDTGIGRSAADAAYLLGKEHSATYAGAARLIMLYSRFGPNFFTGNKQTRYQNDEIVAGIGTFGELLDEAVEKAHEYRRLRSTPRISPVVLAACYYLFTIHDPTNTYRDDFFYRLTTSQALNERDPELATRSYFTNVVAGPKRARLDIPTTFAVLIKAWNARTSGREVQVMRFSANETFPAINFVG